ncbi:MAG: DUF4124 domain-containing protein [Halieaceae bacterium]|nr:DUF4124 domain-containing protein [Halieaceae bacterium]
MDERGVVSFSDQPPDDGPVEAIRIDPPAKADDPDLDARLEAMRETTDRMASDRREREKHRAELRAARAQPEPSPVPTVVQAAPSIGPFWPAYHPWRPRPPLRPPPPLRPHPGHPSAGTPPHPPAAPPGWSVIQPGNAQLMRPVVSKRR